MNLDKANYGQMGWNEVKWGQNWPKSALIQPNIYWQNLANTAQISLFSLKAFILLTFSPNNLEKFPPLICLKNRLTWNPVGPNYHDLRHHSLLWELWHWLSNGVQSLTLRSGINVGPLISVESKFSSSNFRIYCIKTCLTCHEWAVLEISIKNIRLN